MTNVCSQQPLLHEQIFQHPQQVIELALRSKNYSEKSLAALGYGCIIYKSVAEVSLVCNSRFDSCYTYILLNNNVNEFWSFYVFHPKD